MRTMGRTLGRTMGIPRRMVSDWLKGLYVKIVSSRDRKDILLTLLGSFWLQKMYAAVREFRDCTRSWSSTAQWCWIATLCQILLCLLVHCCFTIGPRYKDINEDEMELFEAARRILIVPLGLACAFGMIEMFQEAQRTGLGGFWGCHPGIWCPNHLLQPVISGWPWISKSAGTWLSSHLRNSLDWMVCCYPNADFYESVPHRGQSTFHSGPGTTMPADGGLCYILLDMLFGLCGSWPLDRLDIECVWVPCLHPRGVRWGVLCFRSPIGNENRCCQRLQHHNQGIIVHLLYGCVVDGKLGLCKFLRMPTLLHSDWHQFEGYNGTLDVHVFDVWFAGDRDRKRSVEPTVHRWMYFV